MLKERFISSLILIPIIFFIIWLNSPYTQTLIIIIFSLSIIEWGWLCWKTSLSVFIKFIWFICGLLYISLACYNLWGFSKYDYGNIIFLLIFFFVWVSDTSAYFGGKLIGGAKLVPYISPNKTWAGFFSSLIFVAVIGVILIPIYISIKLNNLYSAYFSFSWICFNAFISIILSIVAQLGDILESWVKRCFHVKDSGNIIPGHGGILDRLDSFFAISIIIGIMNFLFFP